jgi:hypothetical protein
LQLRAIRLAMGCEILGVCAHCAPERLRRLASTCSYPFADSSFDLVATQEILRVPTPSPIRETPALGIGSDDSLECRGTWEPDLSGQPVATKPCWTQGKH